MLPDFLKGQINLPGLGIGIYRLFLIVVGVVLTVGLQWLVGSTRFGAQLRASVDNPARGALDGASTSTGVHHPHLRSVRRWPDWAALISRCSEL